MNKASEHVRMPRVTTSLVGRERERIAIAKLMDQPETQLVTLTGPGGAHVARASQLGLVTRPEEGATDV